MIVSDVAAMHGVGRAMREKINAYRLEAAWAASDWQASDVMQAKQASLKTPVVSVWYNCIMYKLRVPFQYAAVTRLCDC